MNYLWITAFHRILTYHYLRVKNLNHCNVNNIRRKYETQIIYCIMTHQKKILERP